MQDRSEPSDRPESTEAASSAAPPSTYSGQRRAGSTSENRKLNEEGFPIDVEATASDPESNTLNSESSDVAALKRKEGASHTW